MLMNVGKYYELVPAHNDDFCLFIYNSILWIDNVTATIMI